MTALNELIELIKQKRKESDISNTLLRFVQIEAEKLLETEKQQQEEFAIGFAEWIWGNCFNIFNDRFLYKDDEYSTKELLEIYKKTL